MINLYDELKQDFEEITPQEFYRSIFPQGELDKRDNFAKGKYVAIACEFFNEKKENGKQLIKRHSITDDLEEIDELLKSENFIIISPISYAGKSRKTENARYMYAFALEIDGILVNKNNGRKSGYYDLIHQMMTIDFLPTANYIVASGNGLHLYFVLEKPIALFPNVRKSLKNYKKAITRLFWNRYITKYFEESQIQYESAFQGFRMAGGVAKNGERTKVFKITDTPISIEQLNSYVSDEEDKIDICYKSDLTLKEAKEKYPDWYQNRVIEKKPKGSWTCHRGLYDWWLRKLRNKEVKVGHRYYCMMILCVYAIKSGIEREELERDCFSLVNEFDEISFEDHNRFTVKDMADALQSFEDKELVTYPIDTISKRSGIVIKKNKRNFRSREMHIKTVNAMRKFRRDELGEDEYRNNGRPKGSGTKKNIVQEWKMKNPDGKKIDCERDTGLSRHTVLKWW